MDGVISKNEEGNTLSKAKTFDYHGKLPNSILNRIPLRPIILLPRIYARGKEEDIPKRPPPMKYQDLPIYESPHYEYKDFIEDQDKCPNRNTKILHSHLYPYVSEYRRSWNASFCDLFRELGLMKNEICQFLCSETKRFKCIMRHPDNIMARQAILAASTLAGVYLGSGSRGFTKKFIFGSIGALSAGALCFPKETDEIVRDASYNVAKTVISFYNAFCKKNFKLKERGPCTEDLPPPIAEKDVPKKKECGVVKK